MNLKELFGSFNNGRKITTEKVKAYPMYEKFNNNFLQQLLTKHPTKNISDIEYLVIRPHEIYRSRSLYYKSKDKEEDVVSYKLCIQNVFGQYKHESNEKANKISSFRNAISNTKRAEFQSNLKSNCCEDCGILHSKPHIDHYKIPFKQILEQFLYQTDLTLFQVPTVYKHSQHHISNLQLKNEFIDYHDSIVIYKLLCPECNIGHGTYGY
tara:strand:+ start:43 stop:672 length:630 start_codon:yes stop_codon:yes gene_type:complete